MDRRRSPTRMLRSTIGPAPIFASLSLRVAVTPAVALEVLTDFEHMTAFMPNLTSSRLVSRSANVYRVMQHGKADFGPFSFPFESERRIELMPDGRILAQALSGSTKSMRSELHYQAKPAAGRALITSWRWSPSAGYPRCWASI